jgi:hypothetical protein
MKNDKLVIDTPDFDNDDVKKQFERMLRYAFYLDFTKPIADSKKHGTPLPTGPVPIERYIDPEVVAFVLGVPEEEFEHYIGFEGTSDWKIIDADGKAKYDLFQLINYFNNHDRNRTITIKSIPPEQMDDLSEWAKV